MRTKAAIVGLLETILGREAGFARAVLDEFSSIADVQALFDRYGLRWNPVVARDAAHALTGDELEYFAEPWTFAARARAELGVTFAPPEASFVYGSATGDLHRAIMARRAREITRCGVPLATFLKSGWACPVEQRQFYATESWRQCSAGQRYLWGYRCRQCGKVGAGLHVHHIMPIMTAYDDNFVLNFAPWKLTLLCEVCHRAYHRRAMRTRGASGYRLGTDAEALGAQARLRQTWQTVHELALCEFCNRRGQHP